jgi:hypothetical protein
MIIISGLIQFSCVELHHVPLPCTIRHRPDSYNGQSTVGTESDAQGTYNLDNYLHLVTFFSYVTFNDS